MDNPYSAPQSAAAPDDGHGGHLHREQLAQIGEVFVAWEWLRIWYNVVLACVALVAILLIEPSLLLDVMILEQLAVAAIGANACFLAGPLLEGYVTWWWRPARWLRMPVFILGTLGACLLTLIVVAMACDQVADALV